MDSLFIKNLNYIQNRDLFHLSSLEYFFSWRDFHRGRHSL